MFFVNFKEFVLFTEVIDEKKDNVGNIIRLSKILNCGYILTISYKDGSSSMIEINDVELLNGASINDVLNYRGEGFQYLNKNSFLTIESKNKITR